jgi:hypothetical protein
MKKILLIFAVASAMVMGSCERTSDNLPLEDEQSFVRTTQGDIIPGQYVV